MCSILVVEDHKIMAETLVRVLHTRGKFKVADVAESAGADLGFAPVDNGSAR